MHTSTHHIERFWAEDWSLTALLGLLIFLIFFLHPLVELGYDVEIIGSATFTLVLISGIVAVTRSWSARLSFTALALLIAAVHWAHFMAIGAGWQDADAIATFLACGMLAAVVFVQVFRPGPVTNKRIQGAMAGYLLIAVMFAAAYAWLDLRNVGAFGGALTDTSNRAHHAARFGYFSFVTLTTVGYGDIVPIHPFARSLAMMEAFIGQVFPAVLLARLVSLEIYERQRRAA
jgi:hypothetical protein